ncbi:MAG: EAL domain-containing protein [Sideroxydans sp.]
MQITPKYWLGRLKNYHWVGLTLGPLFLVLFLLLIIWTSVYSRIEEEEKIALESVLADNRNVAHIVTANLEEMLSDADVYADMATTIVTVGAKGDARFNPSFFGDRAFLRVVAFDARKRLVLSSAHDAKEPLLSALLNKVEPQELLPRTMLVGLPDSKSGDLWRVPLLLPLGDEKTVGFLGIHLDLGYFLKLYQDVNLGKSGRIEIISQDGYQLIESSGIAIAAGKNIANSDYFALIQKHPQGSGTIVRAEERSPSLVAYEQLERFPFTVAVSRQLDEVLTDHVEHRTRYLWAATFESLALLVAALSLALLARRQQRFFVASQRSEQEKQTLIEQLKQERNKAYKQASHDHLTGLPNRMLFAEVATSHLSSARRSRNLYAVFFIDLDRFKLINDTLGHRIGDLLLCEVARRLRACVRESDLVARIGGDEFVMLISEASSIDDIGLLSAKIIEAVGKPCQLDGHELTVRPSLGISLYGRDGQDIETLLKRADAAMYEAKAAGRGVYRFFDAALNRTSELHVALAQRLPRAISDGELRLHFQARVALEDFRIMGLESLVRWAHPEHGMIFPGDFIPMAEEDGQIVALGHWVIDAACQQLALWRDQGVPLVPVAINVSPRQLRDEELVDRILAALDRHSLSGDLLEVEITESCVIDDQEHAVATLNRLRDKGIKVSMDDYGVGFSNLSLLKSLPIHTIKIDRSLIADIHNLHNDAIIVESTIILAHKLHFRVVAEGVETREQVLHLKVAGCDEVQGYYFHRPAAANEVEAKLRQRGFEKL